MRKIIAIIFLFFILHTANNFSQSNNTDKLRIDLSKYYEYQRCVKDFIIEMKSNLKKHFNNFDINECKNLEPEKNFLYMII